MITATMNVSINLYTSLIGKASIKDHIINVYTENFTNKFLELCEITIPNKVIILDRLTHRTFN